MNQSWPTIYAEHDLNPRGQRDIPAVAPDSLDVQSIFTLTCN